MATWVRLGTGTAPTSTNGVLTGRYSLDNGTKPGDWNSAGVTSVQIAYTITGTLFDDDDTWDDLRAATLDDGTNTAATVNGTDNDGLKNVGSSTDETDVSPNTGLSDAQWEAMAVSGGAGINGAYTDFNQTKGPDGGVQTMSALTVTITYTPGGTPGSASPAAIVRSFTVDAPTLVGPAVDVQDVIARSFLVPAVTPFIPQELQLSGFALTLEYTAQADTPGSASPAAITRSFTVDNVTPVGAALDVQSVINRSFTVDAPTAKGAAVDVQDVIARSFTVDVTTQVGPAVDDQDVIARSFGVNAVTPVGAAVDVQAVIARVFALDQVTPTNSDGGAGSASPAAIVRVFTVDGVTLVAPAVQTSPLIARTFAVDATTQIGPAVDVQDVIARVFTVDAPTPVASAVATAPLLARVFTVDSTSPIGGAVVLPDVIGLSFVILQVTVLTGTRVQPAVIALAFGLHPPIIIIPVRGKGLSRGVGTPIAKRGTRRPALAGSSKPW